MKKLIVFALIALGVSVFAQEMPPAPSSPKGIHKGKKAEMKVQRMAAGYSSRKISDGGFVRFFDLRKKPTDFSSDIREMQKYCNVAIDYRVVEKTAEKCAVKFGFEALKDKDVAVAIVIGNEGDAPTIVACPEDKVVVLNVDKLSCELPAANADETLASRFKKELWRSLAFAMAGYATDFACVMKPVAKPSDIDKTGPQMCPLIAGKIMMAAEQFGVAKMQTVPYGVAVKQGWANPPTNEFQKVIWDKIKGAAKTNKVEKVAAPVAPAAEAK